MKTGPKRKIRTSERGDKVFLGAWIDVQLHEALQIRAEKDHEGNATHVVVKALRKYLKTELDQLEHSRVESV